MKFQNVPSEARSIRPRQRTAVRIRNLDVRDDPDAIVMRRQAFFSVPTDIAVPPLGEVGGLVADPPVRTRRDSTYFDTPGLHLAEAGITVRRDRVDVVDEWTLAITTDLAARYPVVRRLSYRAVGDSGELPQGVVHYLRSHHRRHGLTEVAHVSGWSSTSELRRHRHEPAIVDVCDEHLTVNRDGGVRLPARHLTVLTYDLDGVGWRALDAVAEQLLAGGLRLETVSAELTRYVGS